MIISQLGQTLLAQHVLSCGPTLTLSKLLRLHCEDNPSNVNLVKYYIHVFFIKSSDKSDLEDMNFK